MGREYNRGMNETLLDAPVGQPSTTLPDAAIVGDIEQFPRAAISQLTPVWEEAAPGVGRPRVLPALCLWAGLLVCVVRGFTSQLALWRLLHVQGLWHYPRFALSAQALSQRLGQAGTAPLAQRFGQVRAVLAARLHPYSAYTLAPFASEVLALDEPTLDGVARHLPL